MAKVKLESFPPAHVTSPPARLGRFSVLYHVRPVRDSQLETFLYLVPRGFSAQSFADTPRVSIQCGRHYVDRDESERAREDGGRRSNPRIPMCSLRNLVDRLFSRRGHMTVPIVMLSTDGKNGRRS